MSASRHDGSAARIAAFTLFCADPLPTQQFYETAFGANHTDDGIYLGQQSIMLARATSSAPIGPVNATSFQHFAIVVADMAAAYAHLRGVPGWSPISAHGPVALPANAGGVTAFKFRDPDGHPLELLQFPAGQVPAAWQGRSGLFQGIDHTAISVTDTADSVAFYGKLGFRKSGGSVNQGAAQAALDGLADPCVEVTALALGEAPPHLELLCYRRPAAVASARDDGATLSTIVMLTGVAGGGATLRDPDCHRLYAGDDAPP